MYRVYISGKISGLPIEVAKAKFEAAADMLREAGHRPVSPFDNGLPDDATWEQHMKADIAMMMECDAIFLLPCWQDSKGGADRARFGGDFGAVLFYPCRGIAQ